MKKIWIFNRRDEKLYYDILGTYIIKGGSILVGLVTVPTFIKYFNNNITLGFWFTLLSIFQWMLTFDIGVGNGIRNKLSYAMARKDFDLSQKLVINGYILSGALSFLFFIIGLVIYYIFDISSFFTSSEISSKTIQYVLIIVFIGVLIQFFLKITNSILYSLQKITLVNLSNLITSILILIYTLLFTNGELDTKLLNLSLVYSFCINVPLIITTVILFYKYLPFIKMNRSLIDIDIISSILKLGGSFFLIQVYLLLINSTNEFLISKLYSSEYVVNYSVYIRYFSIITNFFILLVNPIWTSLSKYYAENNITQMLVLYKSLKKILFLSFTLNIFLSLVSKLIIPIWLGQSGFQIRTIEIIVFLAYSYFSIRNISVSSLANAISNLKVQFYYFLFAVILKFSLIFLFSFIYNDWLIVIIVNTLVLIPYSYIEENYLMKRMNFTA